MMIVIGTCGTVGLIVLGLVGWARVEGIVKWVGWENQYVGSCAVRCSAIALLSSSQAILLTMVVQRIYRLDALCRALRLSAVFVFMVCTASAIALAFAGR
jgi:hypothetical protein